jgi:hypothetical protein
MFHLRREESLSTGLAKKTTCLPVVLQPDHAGNELSNGVTLIKVRHPGVDGVKMDAANV